MTFQKPAFGEENRLREELLGYGRINLEAQDPVGSKTCNHNFRKEI